jgi:hypothetical protein
MIKRFQAARLSWLFALLALRTRTSEPSTRGSGNPGGDGAAAHGRADAGDEPGGLRLP